MKLPISLTVMCVVAMLLSLAGCATTTSNTAAVSSSQKQMMLSKAGFVTKNVTNPKLKVQAEKLPVGVVSAVKYKGKLFYVYPTATRDQILVGKQAHYDSYKRMLAAHTNTPINQYGTAPEISGETAGPNHVMVDEFDGMGPLEFGPAADTQAEPN
jgi:hypothetical protein